MAELLGSPPQLQHGSQLPLRERRPLRHRRPPDNGVVASEEM